MSDTRLTQYGFVMGPVEVTRLHRDDKHGAWLELETERAEFARRIGDVYDRYAQAAKERDERITLEQASNVAGLLYEANANFFADSLKATEFPVDEGILQRTLLFLEDNIKAGIKALKKLGRWYETEVGDASN